MNTTVLFFMLTFLFMSVLAAPSSLWKLFGYDPNSAGNNAYGQYNYGSYNYNYQPRSNRGRSYNDGGNTRYKAICHVHASGAEAFPGRIGNPVCPY